MSSDDPAEHTHLLDEADPSVDDATPEPPRRSLRRALVAAGVLTLVLTVLAGGGIWFLTDRYAGNVDRIAGVFDDLDEESRPAAPTPQQETAEEPITFLLVGSDTRETSD